MFPFALQHNVIIVFNLPSLEHEELSKVLLQCHCKIILQEMYFVSTQLLAFIYNWPLILTWQYSLG